MAKGNRQRKHDRAVRQAKSARKQAAARQQQLTELAVQEAEKVLHAIYDPATPAEEFVSVLARQYEGEPVLPMLADSLIRAGSSPERLVELSEAWAAAEAARAEGPTLTYLTFAAGAARVTEDIARARRLLDEALGQAGDPEVRVRLSMHLRTHGRVAEAVELLEGMLREDPEDEFAAEQYALTLEEAFSRLAGKEPPGVCPCGSGDAWPDCCGRRERAALDRFGDRSGLVAFREGVGTYVDRSAYRQRSTGQAFQLTSDEADALAETVTDATEVLVSELAGKPAKRAARRLLKPVPFGRAQPHGVIVHYADPVSAEAARLAGMATGSLLLRLAVEVHEHRVTPPAMTTAEGWEKHWLDEPVPAGAGHERRSHRRR